MADKEDMKLHAQLLKDNMAWKAAVRTIRRQLDAERDRTGYADKDARWAISVGQTVLDRIEKRIEVIAQGGAVEMIDATG